MDGYYYIDDNRLIFMKMQQEELTIVLLLLLATLAIGVLYVAASSSSLIPSAMASVDGSVTIEGTLLHKETTYQGGHILMTVKTIDGPVVVFVPASNDCYGVAAKAEPGCTLMVTGKEQEYKGEPEIVASAMAIK